MRTATAIHRHYKPTAISTPTVQDSGNFQPDILDVTFDGFQTGRAKLIILEKLGSGAQGEVREAKLVFTDSTTNAQREYPCVVKHLFTLNDPQTPLEFKMQKILTDGHSSAHSGALKIMGIHTVIDSADSTHKHKYAIMPKCDAILSQHLPRIKKLKKQADSKALFYHLVMNFFRSMCHGLKNLAEHKITHRDLKPENIGLHNNVWCMLDFGLAQNYQDFQKNNEKNRIEGTPHYIPPERLSDEYHYPFARDVWAIGQILLQLSGEKCLFQVNEHGRESGVFPHLFRKGTEYENRRKIKQNNHDVFDDENYQLELREAILKKDTFEDCLSHITNAMCEILPEHRPNLETLLTACARLESLLSPFSVSDRAINQFYNPPALKQTQQQNDQRFFTHKKASSLPTASGKSFTHHSISCCTYSNLAKSE